MEWCSSLFAVTVSVFQSCTRSSVSSKWIQLFKESSDSLFYIFLKWNCITGCMWSWNPPDLQQCLSQYLQSSSVNIIPWFPYDHVPVLADLRSSSKSSVASWTENATQYQTGRCSFLGFAHMSGNECWNEHLLRDHLACDCELSLDLCLCLSGVHAEEFAAGRTKMYHTVLPFSEFVFTTMPCKTRYTENTGASLAFPWAGLKRLTRVTPSTKKSPSGDVVIFLKWWTSFRLGWISVFLSVPLFHPV